jgi:hypothetical protein
MNYQYRVKKRQRKIRNGRREEAIHRQGRAPITIGFQTDQKDAAEYAAKRHYIKKSLQIGKIYIR